jgi:hypothetical protein
MGTFVNEYLYMLNEPKDIRRVMTTSKTTRNYKYIPFIDEDGLEENDLIGSLFLIATRKPYLGFYGITKIIGTVKKDIDEQTTSLYYRLLSANKICELDNLYFLEYNMIFEFKKILGKEIFLKDFNYHAENYDIKQIKFPRELTNFNLIKIKASRIIEVIYEMNIGVVKKPYSNYKFYELFDEENIEQFDSENSSTKSSKSIKSNISTKSSDSEKNIKLKKQDEKISKLNSEIFEKSKNSDSSINVKVNKSTKPSKISKSNKYSDEIDIKIDIDSIKTLKKSNIKVEEDDNDDNDNNGYYEIKTTTKTKNKVKQLDCAFNSESDSESNSSDSDSRFKVNKFKKKNNIVKLENKNIKKSDNSDDYKYIKGKNLNDSVDSDDSDKPKLNKSGLKNTKVNKKESSESDKKIFKKDTSNNYFDNHNQDIEKIYKDNIEMFNDSSEVEIKKPLSNFDKLCLVNRFNNIKFVKDEEDEKLNNKNNDGYGQDNGNYDEDDEDEKALLGNGEDDDDEYPKEHDEVDDVEFELDSESSKNLMELQIPILWIPCDDLQAKIKNSKMTKKFFKIHYETCSKCEIINNNKKDTVSSENVSIFRKDKNDEEEMNDIIKHYKFSRNYRIRNERYKNQNYDKDVSIIFYYENPEEKVYNKCVFLLKFAK